MILPIVAYGDPVLRKPTEEIDDNYPGLKALINDMFETMYNAPGVGLAAPQVGHSIRLFVVDSEQIFRDEEDEEVVEEYNERRKKRNKEAKEKEPEEKGIKQAFLNPIILKEYGKPWAYEEGCLSIPGIREDVDRPDSIVIEYEDENFNLHEQEFTGLTARIIQHEYDHIEGILFTDRLKPLKKRLIKSKLERISKGDVDVAYKMVFPNMKKGR
ncbi:MAG: peptide deformylase [Chitinophagales bacterium]|nr:peptide deformylase [Chitinophagales bacterium]